VSAVWTRSDERQRQGQTHEQNIPTTRRFTFSGFHPALVAAALAGGMIAAMAPMSADEAVTVFGDALAAHSRAVEAERSDT
jgi:hypothetical protein